MTTSTPSSVRSSPPRRAFHTPVRGHRFAARPTGGDPLERARLRLRCEPDNPADPAAVAVWAESGGRPWRVGYLERAVAVRLADSVADDGGPAVAFAGWWEEPCGRWHRPVVRIGAADGVGTTRVRTGVRVLPPCSVTRRTDAA